ncbi:hypothetical protein PV325_012963 [Microctonus aethiopoides]|nr:hypothetical protein PV325_012963 [Microctonus aethiopoides]
MLKLLGIRSTRAYDSFRYGTADEEYFARGGIVVAVSHRYLRSFMNDEEYQEQKLTPGILCPPAYLAAASATGGRLRASSPTGI